MIKLNIDATSWFKGAWVVRRRLLLTGLCVVLLALVLFAVASWFQFVDPQAPASLRDESLMFLRDVVGFNMTDYKVTASHFWPQTDVASTNGLPLYLMRYELKSSDDEAWVNILYTKANDTWIHEPNFDVYSNTLFSPAYPTDKVLNWTKAFLERYQGFQNNAPYLSEMREVLDTVDHIRPLNTTNGGINLQITIKEFSEQEIYTTLRFAPANSTAHDYENAVTFEFHNGVMLDFFDWYEISHRQVQ